MAIPVMVKEHPLKAEVKKLRLQYWWLRKALGGYPSEPIICRYLNGIDQMPEEIESKLKEIISEHKRPLVTLR